MKTRKELAAELNISVKTLINKCKKYGISLPERELLTPELCQQIKQTFGV